MSQGLEVLNIDDYITISVVFDSQNGKKSLKLKVHGESEIKNIREEIYSKLNIPVKDQYLEFNNKSLNEEDIDKNTPLKDVGILDGSKVFLSKKNVEIVQNNQKESINQEEIQNNLQQTSEKKLKSKNPPKTKKITKSNEPIQVKVVKQSNRSLKNGNTSKPNSKQQGKYIHESDLDVKFDRPELFIPNNKKINVNEAKVLIRWSKYQSRFVIIFMLLCLLLFMLNWGYWSMAYYALAFCFSLFGWYGVRRLSTKNICLFLVFLFIDIVGMLDVLVYTAGRNKSPVKYTGVVGYIFLLLFEILLIICWFIFLAFFAWKIHLVKKLSYDTVKWATEVCKRQVIFV